MDINKNVITYPSQLIGGERQEKGILQLFCTSLDVNKRYATGLNGTYNLILKDVKMLQAGTISIAGCAFQIVSDTLQIDRGNDNTNVKVVVRSTAEEKITPIILKQQTIKNHIEVSFLKLGIIGSDINLLIGGWNITLTIEYERI